MSDETLIKNGYFLFWNGWPSQWTAAPFELEGKHYGCAEQWMMASKARFFDDLATAKAIMKTDDPHQQKKLGRGVKGFDVEKWASVCFDIVLAGNLAKFRQNPDLQRLLLETDDLTMVEASPYDKVWGIGLDMHHKDATHSGKWQGKNLLGKVLDKTRETIRAELSKLTETSTQ
jgi:ribA/ribD-fused uncharacterized protein